MQTLSFTKPTQRLIPSKPLEFTIKTSTKNFISKNNNINYSFLQPKIPHKKLIQKPNIFLSIEKKKFKILSANTETKQFFMQQNNHGQFKGRKMKSTSKSAMTIANNSCLFPKSPSKTVGNQQQLRTPHFSLNLQHLINQKKIYEGGIESKAETLKYKQKFYQTSPNFMKHRDKRHCRTGSTQNQIISFHL